MATLRFLVATTLMTLASFALAGDNLAAPAERAVCTSHKSADDVIAIDYDRDGAAIEYRRNDSDIAQVIAVLKVKVAADPGLTRQPGWHSGMLDPSYYKEERCGGTKNCSSKECSKGSSCVYGNIGMAGCRCVSDNKANPMEAAKNRGSTLGFQ